MKTCLYERGVESIIPAEITPLANMEDDYPEVWYDVRKDIVRDPDPWYDEEGFEYDWEAIGGQNAY